MLAALKTHSIRGFVWSAGESFGVALLSFASFAVMARLLEPRDFGVVALAGVFMFFSNLVVAHSFADVVVQRQHVEPDHLDTVFWSTVGLALLLMAGCQAAAGGAAALFGEPALADVVRLLSLAIPLGAIGSVHLALCRRDMRFGAVAVRSFAGRAAGAVVGVAAALAGFGLWSLVAQQLVGSVVITLAAFTGVAWRPRLRFSRRHVSEIWKFGLNVSTSQIVASVGEQTLNLMVGTLFGTVALGYFTIAWRMVQLVRSLISGAVYHVGLSAFARLQENRAAIARAFSQATRIACLAGFPIGVGITMVSEPLIVALFGEKWAPSVPVLAVLALEMIPTFYGIFFTALYRATGRAGWGLVMVVVCFVLGAAGVLALAPLGMTAVAIFWAGRIVLLMPVHVLLVSRILEVPARSLLTPALVPALSTMLMAVGLFPLRFAMESAGLIAWAQLLLLVPSGALLYGTAVWLLSPELAGLAMRTARAIATPLRQAP